MTDGTKPWDGAIVRTWLERRILAARSDQVAAQRGGRAEEDDCDKAAAEELVCTAVRGDADSQDALSNALKALQQRDDFVWGGVYDDARFDRHVRAYVRKLARMTRDNAGFEQTRRYQ